MKSRDYTTTIRVDATAAEAFKAINDVRGWWAGDIEGNTHELGGEFDYRYENFHVSKQRVVELEADRRVVWLVLDSKLNFIEDEDEWNGTRIEFDISRKGGETEIRFAHVGLVAERECYAACSNAWSSLIGRCLRDLIVSGKRAVKSDMPA
jgi:hypothetical protein